MDDGVANEVCAPVEGFPTLNTFKRLFPTMNALVPRKTRHEGEGLPALRTLIGPLPGVDAEVAN